MDTQATITIRIEYDCYNARRHSRPWGAIITFADNGKPQYDFEAAWYDGSDRGGNVIITCKPGDIIATGQKDNRNPKYTRNNWYLVNPDHSLTPISGADALEQYRNAQALAAAPAVPAEEAPETRQAAHRRTSGQVMRAAWAAAREAVARFGGKASEYLRECLRSAWAVAREMSCAA